MLKVILPHLGDKRIKEITPIDIMQYLQYLRDEYHAPDGRTLSEKSVKHHFDVLRIIFNYAERQEVIEKNPIVDNDVLMVKCRLNGSDRDVDCNLLFNTEKLKVFLDDYRASGSLNNSFVMVKEMYPCKIK